VILSIRIIVKVKKKLIYFLSFLDFEIEDVNMMILPKKDNSNQENTSSAASSYVMDPGFFKREMAKKG